MANPLPHFQNVAVAGHSFSCLALHGSSAASQNVMYSWRRVSSGTGWRGRQHSCSGASIEKRQPSQSLSSPRLPQCCHSRVKGLGGGGGGNKTVLCVRKVHGRAICISLSKAGGHCHHAGGMVLRGAARRRQRARVLRGAEQALRHRMCSKACPTADSGSGSPRREGVMASSPSDSCSSRASKSLQLPKGSTAHAWLCWGARVGERKCGRTLRSEPAARSPFAFAWLACPLETTSSLAGLKRDSRGGQVPSWLAPPTPCSSLAALLPMLGLHSQRSLSLWHLRGGLWEHLRCAADHCLRQGQTVDDSSLTITITITTTTATTSWALLLEFNHSRRAGSIGQSKLGALVLQLEEGGWGGALFQGRLLGGQAILRDRVPGYRRGAVGS